MKKRLTKIVTRTGDAGSTGLGDGTRVPKNSLRIECIGTIDELNSSLGVLLAEELPESAAKTLFAVQNDLFDLGGEICIPGTSLITEQHVDTLEIEVLHFNEILEPLREFILPGGTRAAALTHLCRTVCRRAERRLISLHEVEPVSEMSRKYLNRLSDLLFVLARWLNKAAGRSDVLWVAASQKSTEE